ncbi:nociceptin receptor isoform X2 [Heterocephalus glaber]|uniref:Nociceptin receptor n=1 Tax=Heterocephalus glaber TaxID=10181 RepID=A0AAX6P0S1_HETGA|nr:nociceptin receptor isoform X2 [Heterocephalus glaber]
MLQSCVHVYWAPTSASECAHLCVRLPQPCPVSESVPMCLCLNSGLCLQFCVCGLWTSLSCVPARACLCLGCLGSYFNMCPDVVCVSFGVGPGGPGWVVLPPEPLLQPAQPPALELQPPPRPELLAAELAAPAAAASGLASAESELPPQLHLDSVRGRPAPAAAASLPSLLRVRVSSILPPKDILEVLYSSHLQGNLSLLSPNDSVPPHLLLNASHSAFLPLGLKVTIVGLYLAVCIGGLLGNCLVMYVILRHTKMKTATNIYIFNLALADTLVLLTLPFQGTDILLGFWPFGNALCKTVIAIDYYNMFTSTFTLTAMSVDRYVAICHPIRALDIRTSSKAQAVNVGIWALASVVGVPVAIMGSAQVEDEEIECLVEIPSPQDYWGPVFAVCIFIFSFIIPVLIISVCYSLMIRRLRGVRLLSGSREKDRNLRRITRLVLVVVAVFVGCWTPVQVFVLVQGLGVQPGSETTVAMLRFCTALGYVNSCLNPILYAFLDENFKACFRKFCCTSALHQEMQVSDRVRSIAKDVALGCKTSETVPRPA